MVWDYELHVRGPHFLHAIDSRPYRTSGYSSLPPIPVVHQESGQYFGNEPVDWERCDRCEGGFSADDLQIESVCTASGTQKMQLCIGCIVDWCDPWVSLGSHLNGPDSQKCPWCVGSRTSDGQHAVVIMNGDRPECQLFDNPHLAWSWYDRIILSWSRALLVHVIGNDREGVTP